MATLRKARAYSKKRVVPYTRNSTKRQKSYIKAIPHQKIVKFHMGKVKKFNKGDFPFTLNVYSKENIQIRHNSLEACRQFLNGKINKKLAGQYYFKVCAIPHHIQRENKMLTGAGADRMSDGMRLAFGKAVGKAALVHKDGKIFTFGLPDEASVKFARVLIKQVASKLPGKIKTLSE
jgi:large subunit ribosomal protein L10e